MSPAHVDVDRAGGIGQRRRVMVRADRCISQCAALRLAFFVDGFDQHERAVLLRPPTLSTTSFLGPWKMILSTSVAMRLAGEEVA